MNAPDENTVPLPESATSLMDDLAHDREQILRAVEDVLRTPLDTAAKMDVHGAASTITQFVFHGQTEPDDATRYDWYYMLLGKAVTIAQAWKQNFAGTLDAPSETCPSLMEYIDNTYGTGSCARAGIRTPA
jgi:citrate synthase